MELMHLITNHEEIVSIIESNVHLVRPDEPFLDTLSAYIRHVAVYKALRATNTYSLNPIDVGEPMPDNIIPTVASQLKQIQAEYERLIGIDFEASSDPHRD